MGGADVDETEEYAYQVLTVKRSPNGGSKNMGDRMTEANGMIGMDKFAMSRSKSVIGRERWKGFVVNTLMYRCEALVWYQK